MKPCAYIVAMLSVALSCLMGQPIRPSVRTSTTVVGDLRLQEGSANSGEKSTLVAVGLSLLLPGAGEWYAGNLATGRYFMAADGVLWLGYAGLSLQGSWTRADARLFAAQHSGATFQGKDEQFDVNIGNFMSTTEYNDAKLRNREFDLIYNGTSYQWQWDGESSRLDYKGLRIRSDQMFQNARFVVGALVVNRVISAFSAWRSVRTANRQASGSDYWRLKAEVTGGLLNAHGLELTVTKFF